MAYGQAGRCRRGGGSGAGESGRVRQSHLRLVWPLLCMAAVLLACLPALAAPTSAEQARQIVRGWLKRDGRPLRSPLGSVVTRVDTFRDGQGQALYYVVYLDPSGFVIVPADDQVEPVVGFAPAGRFDPSPDDPLGALVSRDLAGRVGAARQAATPAASRAARQAQWTHLRQIADGSAVSITSLGGVSDVRVAPFVQSRWNQTTEAGAPCYNYFTPNQYPAGCVATAMAQVMRYHQFPVAGVGIRSFTITVDGVLRSATTRGGDGAGGPYNWSLMMLDPDSSITAAQREAIGAICYDAGLSVQMSYRETGSGAGNVGELALVSTFGYSNAVRGYNNGYSIPAANLYDMINTNLDAAHPVLLGISGTVGGHAIVCDGYGYNAQTAYHHLNMGWGGYQDAWYNLPTIDSLPGPFTSVFECGYNIYTAGSGEIISGRVVDGQGNPIPGVTITAQRTGGSAYSAITNAGGIYAVAKVPSNASYTVTASAAGYTFQVRSVSTGRSANYSSAAGNRWAVDFQGQRMAIPGDITGDSRVNVLDLQRLAASWNLQQGQAGYDPACDLNGDGAVNVLDLQILGQNWNKW